MNGRERFDDKQLRNLYRTRYGNAANIITHQIDDHQVLRTILRRIRQPPGLLTIGIGIFKPGQRTFNRTRLDMLILQQNKTFRRKTEDNAFLKTNKRAERGAVSVIEFDECLPLIPLVMRLKTLREVDLVTIAAFPLTLCAVITSLLESPVAL